MGSVTGRRIVRHLEVDTCVAVPVFAGDAIRIVGMSVGDAEEPGLAGALATTAGQTPNACERAEMDLLIVFKLVGPGKDTRLLDHLRHLAVVGLANLPIAG